MDQQHPLQFQLLMRRGCVCVLPRYELGRQSSMTKLSQNTAIRTVRVRGGNKKFRGLRMDTGNYSWGSEVRHSCLLLQVLLLGTPGTARSKKGNPIGTSHADPGLHHILNTSSQRGACMLHPLLLSLLVQVCWFFKAAYCTSHPPLLCNV